MSCDFGVSGCTLPMGEGEATSAAPIVALVARTAREFPELPHCASSSALHSR